MFFHGNPTWSFLYRNVISRLRDQFRCIAADYLGFGLSDRPAGFGYTIEEHAQVMGELVDHLGLDGYLPMGQDWGGPISMAVATARADRVRGVVLGNTWFWPSEDLTTKTFSKVMGSPPMQWAILQRNFFVEKLIPAGTATSAERRRSWSIIARCNRRRRPAPGWRACRRRSWRPGRCSRGWPAEVPDKLGAKPALLVWGMKDFAFRPGANLPRMQAAFDDHVLVELPDAKHYIQEDAPERITEAILDRFG